ncbi:uncharacterized protein V6R79_006728 [Siganus canaliculatus]
MDSLVAALLLCALVPSAHSASDQIQWCYHDPSCNDTTWPTIAAQFCNGSRQSPIDIVSASAQPDSSLVPFTFNNFSSTTALNTISNTGKTVKVTLNGGVSISGGALSEPYDSLQFHLHWGNGVSVPGSEHTVDGKRYPMELHIVNSKGSLNGNTTAAVADSTGLAALGWFIEAITNETDQPSSWKTLTDYLSNITESGQSATVQPGVSLNDLIGNVDLTSYYRYLGSLTTPNCNEAVVWTVFKQPIRVSSNLINLFSSTLHIGNSSSILMQNVFRNVQPAQRVTTQAASSSSAVKGSLSVGLLALTQALWRV